MLLGGVGKQESLPRLFRVVQRESAAMPIPYYCRAVNAQSYVINSDSKASSLTCPPTILT